MCEVRGWAAERWCTQLFQPSVSLMRWDSVICYFSSCLLTNTAKVIQTADKYQLMLGSSLKFPLDWEIWNTCCLTLVRQILLPRRTLNTRALARSRLETSQQRRSAQLSTRWISMSPSGWHKEFDDRLTSARLYPEGPRSASQNGYATRAGLRTLSETLHIRYSEFCTEGGV